MKKLILTGAIALISGICGAQNEQTAESSEEVITPKILHKLGLHAGTTSGTGLSYKVDINKKYQIQLVALPVASEDVKWINSGVQFRYKVRNLGDWDFFTYGAASYFYQYQKEYYYNDGYTMQESFSESHAINTSAGIAFEYGRSEAFKLNIQTGYGGYDLTDDWRTMLSIGVGIDFTLTKLN